MKHRIIFWLLLASSLWFIRCGGGYQLHGVVYDAALKAVPNARVVVRYNAGKDSVVTIADEQGNFTIKNVKAKDAKIIIRSPNFRPLEQDLVFKKDVEVNQFKLVYRPTRIIGRVLCSETHKPLPGVKVTEMVSEVSVLTNENGKFVIDRGLDPDLEQILYFTKTNYNRKEMSVKAIAHQDVDVGDVLLTPLPGYDPSLNTADDSEFSVDDQRTPLDAAGIQSSGRLESFLVNNERFTFQQFQQLLNEIHPNNTEKNTRENLEYYIQKGWIEEIEPGLYKSNRYNPNP